LTWKQISVADQQVLLARRSEVIQGVGKARLHTFVVVFSVQGLELERAEELTDSAQHYANKHKGGIHVRAWRSPGDATVQGGFRLKKGGRHAEG
jgi:hypothetical protein